MYVFVVYRVSCSLFSLDPLLFFFTLHYSVQPVNAQFGLKKQKKGGSSFEELNEMMKDGGADGDAGLGDLGDLAGLQELMANAMKDPETMKMMEQMQAQFAGALEKMAEIDPEEMQKQMAEALKLMADGDMVDSIISRRDEVLASLKQTGLVDAEELAKYEADPKYFEDQMRNVFGQMSGLFSDPDLIRAATEQMAGIAEASKNPVAIEMGDILMADNIDDDRIEELRLLILQNPDALSSNPIYSEMVSTDDFQEQLKDAKKWKAGVMEAREMMKGAGDLLSGAGIGEL